MATTTTTPAFSSVEELIDTASTMTACDFLSAFDSIIEVDEMENMLDGNEGMVNLSVPVKSGKGLTYYYILFIDGKYDSIAG